MSESTRIAILVGSLRAESFSRKIAQGLIAAAPKSVACKVVEIGDLALYNEDLDHGNPPKAWAEFRTAMREVDAVVFVTPEYNRSIPAALKNALDVGSRPQGQSVFDGMPAGVVSVTPYRLGAFGANHALRQTFVFLNMPAMQQPEVYIGDVASMLDEAGKVNDADTKTLLAKFMQTFETWARKIRGAEASQGDHDFESFMQKRREIARDYVNGESSSLEAILTKTEPASFFSPGGDVQRGAAAVASRYAQDAKSFKAGGTTKLDIIQSGASGSFAFWTGLQHAEAHMGKDGKPVTMTLRITEIFRVEDGEFELVHRHADKGEKA